MNITPPATAQRLLTNKASLNETRIEDFSLRPAMGEIVLKIDRVALTTNNITYAAFGDAMHYWDFFPTGDANWGHMPAWGFADVVTSEVAGVEVGERFYGYFPLATQILMRPERVTPRGFYDASEHRRTLTSAYNQYTRCSQDEVYSQANENYQMLVRPLFLTSFMCADFLQDAEFFGAKQIVVSSASSKTAYGTAFCLDGHGIKLIALTSTGNKSFVEQLGCYQQAITYDELTKIDTCLPTLYLDFSGDEALRAKVHQHFGNTLVYDCFAGSAQNTQFLRDTALPGPEPKFYFAPVQIRKRNADWGPAVVTARYNAAELDFIHRVSAPDTSGAPWMRIKEHRGFAAAQILIDDLHAGRIDPALGHVVILVSPEHAQ